MVVAVLIGAACGGGSNPGDGGIDAPDDPHKLVVVLPTTINRNVDLLFVIDDSSSMADKQTNLAANFPNLINVLNAIPGGLPNVHIGVVTTDMGTKGAEVGVPGLAIGQIGAGGCAGTGKSGNLQTSGAPVTGTFISDIKQTDGSRVKNYTGNLDSVFSQMARVGAGGCGFEQPLEAMKAALSGNAANAGFLRPDAILAVVFLTDEDDCSFRTPEMLGPESPTLGPLLSFRCTRFGVTCSGGGANEAEMNTVGTKTGCRGTTGSTFMTDVEPYRSFLLGLKADPRLVVAAAFMAPTSPYVVEARTPPSGGADVTALASSCMYQGAQGVEVADPPARIKQFLDLFPGANAVSTICQQDLTDGVVAVAELVNHTVGSPCINALLADADPNTPGLQPDCVVDDTVGATVTPIEACGSPTCWRLETDVMNCVGGDHQKLVIERTGAPDPATITRMRCLIQ